VSAPFVCAPFDRSQAKLALRSPRATTQPRPPHPVPTFVTMANAPLKDRMAAMKPVIWVKWEVDYF
jgi:hypothetical protein